MSVSPLPLSQLGKLTGRFFLEERIPLMAISCYLDGSETSGLKDDWLTLAGIVASDTVWATFQRDWEDMLIINASPNRHRIFI